MSDVQFKCPFCGGTCTTVSEVLAVLHSLPPCQTFLDLDPDAFLHAVNEKLGNHTSGGLN